MMTQNKQNMENFIEQLENDILPCLRVVSTTLIDTNRGTMDEAAVLIGATDRLESLYNQIKKEGTVHV